MKFSRKLKKTDLFKRSFHYSRKKLSNRDLSIKINEVKNSKKKDTSTIKLPLITPLSSPRIEEVENECMSKFRHQSYLSLNKSLAKSYSSPLPINTNHLSISNNHIQSAHIIDYYPYENKNQISLYSCASEIENDQSTESVSSDEDTVQRNLIQYHEHLNRKNLRHRWSLLDIWETTIAKLPSILNCLWRKRLHRTGSNEFLLEYDQTLPTNNNNNNRASFLQERPINSHIGLALFASFIFPPVGIFAFMLSIWSLYGQQDRHLSRKFGNAVYWISILSICLSFLLLSTLFTYFTYQYLTTQRIRHLITNDIEYI